MFRLTNRADQRQNKQWLKSTDTVLGLTAQIVSAHVSKNAVEPDKLPELIREVYRTLASVGEEPAESAKPKAAVPPTQIGVRRLHRLPGRRQEDEDVEAASDDRPQADAGSVPGALGPAARPIRWWRRIMPRPDPRWRRRSVWGRNDRCRARRDASAPPRRNARARRRDRTNRTRTNKNRTCGRIGCSAVISASFRFPRSGWAV